MSNSKINYFLSLVTVLAVVLSGFAQDNKPSGNLNFYQTFHHTFPAIEQYVKSRMQNDKIPAVAYGICYKDSIVKIDAIGLADVQNNAIVLPQTRFELASITKQFTAAAILKLSEQGKLSIEDSISNYFRKAPAHWKGIKIKHLLTHTSGLPELFSPSYTGFQDMGNDKLINLIWTHNFTARLSFDAIKKDKPTTSPGEKYAYSDVGYNLLGLIIQEVTGSYRSYMQENIFNPAGLSDTYILDQATIHPLEARGYSLKNGELINIKRFFENEVPSHYGIFSNVSDILKWSIALDENLILSRESKDIMWTGFKLNNGLSTGYGFGWKVNVINGKKVISHSGITGTEIIKIPEDSLTVVVLTNLGNCGNDQVNSWGIASEIITKLGYKVKTNESYVTREGAKVIKISSKTAKAITGTYNCSDPKQPEFKITVSGESILYHYGSGKSELGLLDNGNFLILNMDDEYILEKISEKPLVFTWRHWPVKLTKVK